MSTMVERLAKAILEEIREGGAFVNTIDDDLSCLVLVDGDVDMLAVARAAIEAMMEPTTWMLSEAVEIAVEQDGNVSGNEYWQRMIQAALKEQE